MIPFLIFPMACLLIGSILSEFSPSKTINGKIINSNTGEEIDIRNKPLFNGDIIILSNDLFNRYINLNS